MAVVTLFALCITHIQRRALQVKSDTDELVFMASRGKGRSGYIDW